MKMKFAVDMKKTYKLNYAMIFVKHVMNSAQIIMIKSVYLVFLIIDMIISFIQVELMKIQIIVFQKKTILI